ncbi:hypothetical protein L208DRAFT_1062748, partial [Tricholoma matsutake]
DLLTIFLGHITVKFRKGENSEMVTGRWCLLCKIDPEIGKSGRLHKVFLSGSNSSCHQHIHQHYPIYQQRCLEQGLEENHREVPPCILKEREDVKKPQKQG